MLDYALIGENLPIQRSFSTMGLAEIWAALGISGVALSGAILGYILSVATKSLEKPTPLFMFVYSVFIIGNLYMILRVGFLNTYTYNLIITYVIAYFFNIIAKQIYFESNRKLKNQHKEVTKVLELRNP
jgi:hypothetical protein